MRKIPSLTHRVSIGVGGNQPAGNPAPRLSRRKRLLFLTATLLLSLLLPLLAAEALFRLFPGLLPHELQVQLARVDSKQALFAADDVLEHRAVPGFDAEIPHAECPHHVRTLAVPHLPGEWGFRTPPVDPDRPVRAAVLGDSVAFGYGVEEAETLAGRLRAVDAADGQVVNLGLANKAGTLQYERILHRFLEHYRPDDVVILHFENDYTDDAFFEEWERRFSEDASFAFPRSRQPGDPGGLGLLRRMKRQSLCLTLLANAARKAAADRQRVASGEASYVLAPEVLEMARPDDPAAARGFELGLAALERMIAASRAAAADVTVVMIPAKEQVLADESKLEESTRLYRATAEACRRRGATVVELLDAFRGRVRDEQLYFVIDGHLTADGNAAMHRALKRATAARDGAVHR